MPFDDARSHLADILSAIESIEEFVRGMSFDDYRDDSKTQSAVERKMLIISEAAVPFTTKPRPFALESPGAISAASATGSAINTTAWISRRFGTRSRTIFHL